MPATPTDEYRWITRERTQRKWVTVIGPDYYGMKEGHDHMPVWVHGDEALKGMLWRPVTVEWRDVENNL